MKQKNIFYYAIGLLLATVDDEEVTDELRELGLDPDKLKTVLTAIASKMVE